MPKSLELQSPVPYQVVQRKGLVPSRAHEHAPGEPALGHGMIPIICDWGDAPGALHQYRAVPLPGAFGEGTDWTSLGKASQASVWSAQVPAGGWYRLEVRSILNDQVIAFGSVEPVGVGEILVVAGQSYAAGHNEELTRVEDPQGRIVACDTVNETWRVAHDPQPNVGEDGTIWPAMGNALLPLVRVPIGFVNVARGSTASRQWLPGEELYNNLAAAGKAVERFRAVLWQQGESDVIEKVTIETYIDNLGTIRGRLAEHWGFEPPWLLAKSTLHPTVYNDPVHENQIREAINDLWRTPGFGAGPDTDILGGVGSGWSCNRGGEGSNHHFSAIGQKRAGLMWFAVVWNMLNQHEAQE